MIILFVFDVVLTNLGPYEPIYPKFLNFLLTRRSKTTKTEIRMFVKQQNFNFNYKNAYILEERSRES